MHDEHFEKLLRLLDIEREAERAENERKLEKLPVQAREALGLLSAAFMGYQWYLITTSGQTVAKRWLGIKIVRNDGHTDSRPKYRKIAQRSEFHGRRMSSEF